MISDSRIGGRALSFNHNPHKSVTPRSYASIFLKHRYPISRFDERRGKTRGGQEKVDGTYCRLKYISFRLSGALNR